MIGARFELPSARGDKTLGQVKFVLHSSDRAGGSVVAERGLAFIEGTPVVSANLVSAQAEAAEIGGVVSVLMVPADLHLGYAAFTTAYIQRVTKLVSGAPLKYAAARKLLSLYLGTNTETARKRVELEVAGGESAASRPRLTLPPPYVIGLFAAGSALASTVGALEVAARAFEPVDGERVERALVELFECREPAQAVLVPSMAHGILVGTIESLIITRLRTMRWQGLAQLGYRFQEGREDVAVSRVTDLSEQRGRMDEYGRMVAGSNMFTGELAWLKVYALHELNLMRVELDGAELESA